MTVSTTAAPPRLRHFVGGDWRTSETYRWVDGSTYVKNPPYFEGITMEPPSVADIKGARILAEPPEESLRRFRRRGDAGSVER